MDQHSTKKKKKKNPLSFSSRMSSEDLNKSKVMPDLRIFAKEITDGKLQNLQNFP